MEAKTVVAIKIGVGLGLLFITYKVLKKYVIKTGVLSSFGDKGFASDKGGNKGGFTLPQETVQTEFDPRMSALNLKNAMEGIGTDDSLFWATVEPLSKEELKTVESYFNTYLGEGETLEEWINGDFSDSDLQKALNYFK